MAVTQSTTDIVAPALDWRAAERSPEFAALLRERRRFLLPALAAVALFYAGFVLMAALARGAMGATLIDPFTLGELWAVAQIPVAWIVAGLYLRHCTRRIDPLAAQVLLAAESLPAEPIAAEDEVVHS